MVILKEDNLPPGQCRLNRIIIYAVARVATILCASGKYKRAINRIR